MTEYDWYLITVVSSGFIGTGVFIAIVGPTIYLALSKFHIVSDRVKSFWEFLKKEYEHAVDPRKAAKPTKW